MALLMLTTTAPLKFLCGCFVVVAGLSWIRNHMNNRGGGAVVIALLVSLNLNAQCQFETCEIGVDLTGALGWTSCAQLNSNLCELTEPFDDVVALDADGDLCGAYNRVWWATFTVATGDPLLLMEVIIEGLPVQFTDEIELRLFEGPCTGIYADPAAHLIDCSGIVDEVNATYYLPDGVYYIAVDGVDISQGVFQVCVTQDAWLLGLGIDEPMGMGPKHEFLLRWLRGEILIDAAGRIIR